MIFVDEPAVVPLGGKQRSWDEHFIEGARWVASRSRDRSTQCGCVLVGPERQVLSTGYNGLVRGIAYDDPLKYIERPWKYFWMEHSERNAIYNAARHGAALRGSTAYVTGPCCSGCMRALLQSGVVEVVIPEHHNLMHWLKPEHEGMRNSAQVAANMAREVGIIYRTAKGV